MPIQLFPCFRIQTELQKFRSSFTLWKDELQQMIAERTVSQSSEHIATLQNSITFCEKVIHSNAELKREEDSAQLEKIETKIRNKESLDKEDLLFLYEVRSLIQPFDKKDERIHRIRRHRKPNKDLFMMFSQDQIARTQNEVTSSTKIYIGPLFPNIFLLPQLEYIYTSFPNIPVRKTTMTIGGKSKQQLETELNAQNIDMSPSVTEVMHKPEFTTLTTTASIVLVNLTVADLGFPHDCTTDQLFAKVKNLGLDFCPAEVGPHYILQCTNPPTYHVLNIGMQPIKNSHDYSGILEIDYYGNPPSFRTHNQDLDVNVGTNVEILSIDRWHHYCEFFFALRTNR